MAVTDPYQIKQRDGRWMVTQGRETIYNSSDELVLFQDPIEALAWIINNRRPQITQITIEFKLGGTQDAARLPTF